MRDRARAGLFVVLIASGACAPSMPAGDGGSALDGAVSPSADAAAPADASGRPLSEFRDGIATYYDATGAGNCSFDPSPGDLMVAAMNAPEWNNSAVCGACAEVMGPSGSVIVRIVDRCPECAAGHLDLSREAFERVAPIASGRVATRWRFVECAPRGPISFKWKDGTNQWWAALQVRDHRLPIERVEVQPPGGAFTVLARQSYNYFIGTDLGVGPFTVRVTAQGGAQITESNVALGDNTVVAGTRQF